MGWLILVLVFVVPAFLGIRQARREQRELLPVAGGWVPTPDGAMVWVPFVVEAVEPEPLVERRIVWL